MSTRRDGHTFSVKGIIISIITVISNQIRYQILISSLSNIIIIIIYFTNKEIIISIITFIIILISLKKYV